MDQMASHLDEAYDGAQAWMKVHIPAGLRLRVTQTVTGEDINFNFLTYYADDRTRRDAPHGAALCAG